ncbi:MAG: hypothetical protein AAFX87_14610 [Bacteroidota bacterium]
MKFYSKIKCSLKANGNLSDYYAKLSKEELLSRKSNQKNIYLTTTIMWVSALVITVLAAKMSLPILILYSGAVIATVIASWAEYRKRMALIDRFLNAK